MTITTALAGLKTASDLTTRLREAPKSREIQLDEVVARIIEIQDLISDGRTAFIDAQDQVIQKGAEIQQLKDEIRALKEQWNLEQSVTFESGAYWKVSGDRREGPFCPTCWDLDRKLVRPAIHRQRNDGCQGFVCGYHSPVRSFYVPKDLIQDNWDRAF